MEIQIRRLPIQKLNFEFVNDFSFWLKTERKCGQNATAKYVSILKMVVLFYVDNNWLIKELAEVKMKCDEKGNYKQVRKTS
jgi:hypothetical protein